MPPHQPSHDTSAVIETIPLPMVIERVRIQGKPLTRNLFRQMDRLLDAPQMLQRGTAVGRIARSETESICPVKDVEDHMHLLMAMDGRPYHAIASAMPQGYPDWEALDREIERTENNVDQALQALAIREILASGQKPAADEDGNWVLTVDGQVVACTPVEVNYLSHIMHSAQRSTISVEAQAAAETRIADYPAGHWAQELLSRIRGLQAHLPSTHPYCAIALPSDYPSMLPDGPEWEAATAPDSLAQAVATMLDTLDGLEQMWDRIEAQWEAQYAEWKRLPLLFVGA